MQAFFFEVHSGNPNGSRSHETDRHGRTSLLPASDYGLIGRGVQVSMKCPICQRTVVSTGEDSPFCSERCRLIDLGNWASESYKVRAPLPDLEEASSRPEEGAGIGVTGHPGAAGIASPAQTRNGDSEAKGN